MIGAEVSVVWPRLNCGTFGWLGVLNGGPYVNALLAHG